MRGISSFIALQHSFDERTSKEVLIFMFVLTIILLLCIAMFVAIIFMIFDHVYELDTHLECDTLCRYAVLRKRFDQFPLSFAEVDVLDALPLHVLLWNQWSSIDTALMMMEKYPAALQHLAEDDYLPLHIECYNRC
jgi:hypothetical protein